MAAEGAHVEIIPVLSDNYAYLLIDPATKTAAAVDPVEPDKVLARAEECGVEVTHILTTHQHWDHAGGNIDFAARCPGVEVIGGKGDSVPAATREVGHDDVIVVGSLEVRALFTPCHTPGHVCFFVGGAAPLVFTGDTMFVGGCGNFNAGTPAMMLRAMVDVLGALPRHTRVYCGHEYTEKNLRFATFAEPDNAKVAAKLERVRALRARGEPTVPSTLAEEWDTNPFLRVDEPAIRKFTGAEDAVAAMKAVRAGKDAWGRRA